MSAARVSAPAGSTNRRGEGGSASRPTLYSPPPGSGEGISAPRTAPPAGPAAYLSTSRDDDGAASRRAAIISRRYGGDEFLCSLSGVSLASAKARFEEIDLVVRCRNHPGSMSVGLADLQSGETSTDLTERADQALIVARSDVLTPTPLKGAARLRQAPSRAKPACGACVANEGRG